MSQTSHMYKNKSDEIHNTPILSYPENKGAPVKIRQDNKLATELFPESQSDTGDSIMNDKYPKNKKGGKLKKSRKLRKSRRKKSFRRTSRK